MMWDQLKNFSSIKLFLEIFLLMKKSAKFFITSLQMTMVITQATTTLLVAM